MEKYALPARLLRRPAPDQPIRLVIIRRRLSGARHARGEPALSRAAFPTNVRVEKSVTSRSIAIDSASRGCPKAAAVGDAIACLKY